MNPFYGKTYYDAIRRGWRRVEQIELYQQRVRFSRTVMPYFDSSIDLVADDTGEHLVDIRLAHDDTRFTLVATLFFDYYPECSRQYYIDSPGSSSFSLQLSSDTSVSWPAWGCGWSLNPSNRNRNIFSIQLSAWREEYDALVLGNIGPTILANEGWSLEILDNPHSGTLNHAVLRGPEQDPTDFIHYVETFLHACQSTPDTIPWLGMRKHERLKEEKVFDTADPVFARQTLPTGHSLWTDHYDKDIVGLRPRMDGSDPAQYFPAFCVELERGGEWSSIIRSWLSARSLYPNVQAMFQYLFILLNRTLTFLGHKNFRDAMKATEGISDHIPKEVEAFLRKAKVTVVDETPYEAARMMDNQIKHSRISAQNRVEFYHAVHAMSATMLHWVGTLIWNNVFSVDQPR